MSKPIASEISKTRVLDFQPPKIERGVPEVALTAFDTNQGKSSGFRMSEVIKVQTGLSEIEAVNFEEEVEKKTLERIKEIQESAYQEAYQLGMDEGKKEAYSRNSTMIEDRLKAFDELIASMIKLKTDLIAQNERHLIELSFHMAKRLAAHEISINPETVSSVMKQAVEMAQSEEKITIQVHPQYMEFLENLRTHTGREYEFLKRAKFEADESVGPGGCVVISNYGEVDSRFDERVQKLWAGIEESLPRPKERLSVAG